MNGGMPREDGRGRGLGEKGFEEASVVQRTEYVGMQRGCMGGFVFWVCDGV